MKQPQILSCLSQSFIKFLKTARTQFNFILENLSPARCRICLLGPDNLKVLNSDTLKPYASLEITLLSIDGAIKTELQFYLPLVFRYQSGECKGFGNEILNGSGKCVLHWELYKVSFLPDERLIFEVCWNQ